MRRKRGRRAEVERGINKIERKVWTGCEEATNEEQHRRHFYRLFSLVLRIRSRDRARNDITALYELHLRNAGICPRTCTGVPLLNGSQVGTDERDTQEKFPPILSSSYDPSLDQRS